MDQHDRGAHPRPVRFAEARILMVAILGLALATCLAAGGAIYHEVYRLDDVATVWPDRLYRCAQPTRRQFWNFSRFGIKRVISLRGYARAPELLEDERAACAAAGAEFVRVPINTPMPTEQQIRDFVHAVETSPGPVLVHCQHGRTRTGMMASAYLVLAHGWAVEKAVETELVGHFPEVQPQVRDRTIDLLRRVVADGTAARR